MSKRLWLIAASCSVASLLASWSLPSEAQDLTRAVASQLLRKTNWQSIDHLYVVVKGDRPYETIDGANLAVLDELESAGLVSKQKRTYSPAGGKRAGPYPFDPTNSYPGQMSSAPHNYTVWEPTEKLKPLLQQGQGIPAGYLKIRVATSEFARIRGIAKISDYKAKVEFDGKWNFTPAGEAIQKVVPIRYTSRTQGSYIVIHGAETTFDPVYLTKYDDGWRLD